MITSQTVFPIKIASTFWEDKHLLGEDFLKEITDIFESVPDNRKLETAAGDHDTTLRVLPDIINLESMKPLKFWLKNIVYKMWEEIGYAPTALAIERSWINQFKQGSRLRSHAHSSTEMVMTYYHKVPPGSSSITLYNPFELSTGMAPYEQKSITIYPQEGQLLAWPGFMWHEVNEQTIEDTRIAISMHVHQASYYLADRWRLVD
jgi:uncharacterized protein (TIGR02466 family)